MSKSAMFFSLLQIPRYTHAYSWWERIPNFSRRCSGALTLKVFGSGHSEPGRRQYRRQSRQTVDTQVSKMGCLSSKFIIENETAKVVDETAKVGTFKSWDTGVESTQIYRIQQLIGEEEDLAEHVTFIVFDLETTGFSRRTGRIIEIALQDLGGGNNSTFQTLVNPQCYVPNSDVHHITTHMVNRPEVPRMEDLIPILIRWIESRRKPDGIVVLIAHNARTFDAPFLTNEFSRCSYKVPSHYFFLDTMALGRDVWKSRGMTGNAKLSLDALCQLYGIRVPGTAHRALVDVKMLSLVYQRMTFELKLSIPRVLEEVLRQSELGNTKKKKRAGSLL